MIRKKGQRKPTKAISDDVGYSRTIIKSARQGLLDHLIVQEEREIIETTVLGKTIKRTKVKHRLPNPALIQYVLDKKDRLFKEETSVPDEEITKFIVEVELSGQ